LFFFLNFHFLFFFLIFEKKKVEDVCSKFEHEFELIGCTAIEDKLQDGVPETIKYMLAVRKQNKNKQT